MIPQIICISLFIVVLAVCIFDFKQVQVQFNKIIDWIHLHPYEAVLVIIFIYTISIVFTFPTTGTHIILGFTYAQVF